MCVCVGRVFSTKMRFGHLHPVQKFLMHRVSFWSISECLSCPQFEKMDLKIIVIAEEGLKICRRCWKTEESAGHGG